MSLMNTETTYGSVSKFFHWLIFFLVLLMLLIGFSFHWGIFPDKEIKGLVVNLHKLTGITLLFLVILRLFWNLFNRKPRLPYARSWLSKLAERSVHFFLYIVLIAMPLSGWIMSTAAGKFPNFFGILLPFPGIPSDQTLADLFFEAHQILAWVLIVLVLIHVLAALKHYYINKDNVLQRMLPFGKK